jgi:hypothetical protein
MTLNRVFFGTLLLLVIGSLAGVSFGLGDHSVSARISAGMISAALLILGVGMVRAIR